jgi:hypothetical protein
MTTPPSTITRRKEKIPRSPALQSYEPPTEPPTDTPVLNDEETYDNEPSTPTPNRRRPPTDTRASRARIPRADASALPLPPSANEQTIQALMRTIDSQNEANRQIMQFFMQTIERLAPGQQPVNLPATPGIMKKAFWVSGTFFNIHFKRRPRFFSACLIGTVSHILLAKYPSFSITFGPVHYACRRLLVSEDDF